MQREGAHAQAWRERSWDGREGGARAGGLLGPRVVRGEVADRAVGWERGNWAEAGFGLEGKEWAAGLGFLSLFFSIFLFQTTPKSILNSNKI